MLPVGRGHNALQAENTLAVVQSSHCVSSEKHQLRQRVGAAKQKKKERKLLWAFVIAVIGLIVKLMSVSESLHDYYDSVFKSRQ